MNDGGIIQYTKAMSNTTRPSVLLDSGRRVKPTCENENYFFYNFRKEDTAKEVCAKLRVMGYKASIGTAISGLTKWFVRVPIDDSAKKD